MKTNNIKKLLTSHFGGMIKNRILKTTAVIGIVAIGLTGNVWAQLSDVKTAVENAGLTGTIDGNFITVTGDATGRNTTLVIRTGSSGSTVIWRATLSGNVAGETNSLVQITGTNGAFTMEEGSITNTGTGIALEHTAANVSMSILGGALSSQSGNAIRNGSTGSVFISGGTLTATTGYAVNNFTTGLVSISGDAVISSGNSQGTIHLREARTNNQPSLIIGGGTISNTGTGKLIYRTNTEAIVEITKPYAVYDLYYTGSPQTGVSPANPQFYTLSGTVSATNANSWPNSDYTATVTPTGIWETNYRWNGGGNSAFDIEWTIGKANAVWATPVAIDVPYKSSLYLSDITPPDGYKWDWSYSGTFNVGDEKQIPAYYNPDEANYNDASGYITVNIKKGTGNFGYAYANTVYYRLGLTLADIEIIASYNSGGYKWDYPATPLDVSMDGQAFPVTFTDPSGNFHPANGTITLNIRKGTPNFGSPDEIPITWTPGLTLAGISLPSGYTWNNPSTLLNAGQGQEFSVTYNPDPANYNPVSGNITLNVARATGGDFGTHPARNTTYTPTLTLADISLNADYEWVNPSTTLDVSMSGQEFDAVFVHPSGNYEAEGTIVVNVAKAQIAKPTVTNTTLVYSSSKQSAGIATNAAYTMEYDEKTNAGDYTATVSLSDKNNYEWTDGTTNDLNLNWSISPKSITIEGVTAVNRDTNSSADVELTGGTLVGVYDGDMVSFTLGKGTMVDVSAGTNKPVTTSIVLTGTHSSNYTLTQPTNVTVNIGTNNTSIVGTETNVLKVYPNPVTTGELKIDNGEFKNGIVEIFDMKGKRVYHESFSIFNSQFSINISHLPDGIYIVKIGNHSARIIKQ